jgi:superfamily II DNA helicase RecQ
MAMKQQDNFGFKFRGVIRQVINAILSGQDAITEYAYRRRRKSICFQLPALLSGITIVFSIGALMKRSGEPSLAVTSPVYSLNDD